MTQDIITFELARLLESQGYYQDALDMYKELQKENDNSQIQGGISRVETKLAVDPGAESGKKQEKIAELLEEWVELIVLRHRLGNFKQIKSRLI